MSHRRIFVGPGLNPMRAGATDLTRIADIVVPEIFSGYVQTLTQEKSRLVRSGALQVDATLSANLNGGGLTFNEPFFNDLLSSDEHQENISTDKGPDSTPDNITAATEVQIRLSRNKSWGSADLTAALAGTDPMNAIANRVADWRVRRLQHAWIATMKGVFAMGDTANATPGVGGASTHVQGDMVFDLSKLNSGTFKDGVTNFNPSGFIAATGTMGDSMEELSMVMMHSVVYQRLQNLNLIDFIPDARGEVMIRQYMGREVIVDDGMPFDLSTGKYETWLFGSGATMLGAGSPKVPVAIKRKEEANNGAGEETLFNRWEWIIHPVGHAYAGPTTAKGGPTNSILATGSSWKRVFAERKQIKIARLVTMEHAPI